MKQVYDMAKISFPDFAYLSVSETPLKQNSKAYTFGFEYALTPWLNLHEVTAKYGYSTMIFKDGHRAKANVIGFGNIFIFDIDSKPNKPSYTAREVIAAARGLKSLVVSTRSHTQEHHRLRLILLADKILKPEVDPTLYREIMLTIIDFCGLDADMLDTSCFDVDRQYAPNPNGQKQYYIDGDLLPMEFIVKMAQDRQRQKRKPAKQSGTLPHIQTTLPTGDLKMKRAFIKERMDFHLMQSVLEERGLLVDRTGKVTIPGNPTNALHIDMKTGLLRDFANDTSYDPVSVLHDYYRVPLKDATNYIYEKTGGL